MSFRDRVSRSLSDPVWCASTERWLYALGGILVVVTGLWNIGIIAMDDYYSLTAFALPAQSHSIAQIVAESEIRSPLPRLFLFALAKLGLSLGLESPIGQLRLMLAIVGALGFAVSAAAGRTLFSPSSRERVIWAALIGFYFVSPLLLSRAMLESLAAPWVLASAVVAGRFARRPSVSSAVLAAALLGVAFAFRFQAGVCGLALAAVVAASRRPLALLACLIAGAMSFSAVGLADMLLRGRFHESLAAYFQYNVAHSSSYGRTPFYAYPLLFVGLSIPPALFVSYRGFSWRSRFSALWPGLCYFVVFLVAHTMVPHKEERFMTPILPLFLCLIVPLVDWACFARPERWRFYYFAGVNAALLLLACFNIPQQNVLGVVAYLNDASEVRRIFDVDDSLVMYPSAFLKRPIERVQVKPDGLPTLDVSCSDAMAVLQYKREAWGSVPSGWRRVASFGPGPLEAVVVKLNPAKNQRRGPVELYVKSECGE